MAAATDWDRYYRAPFKVASLTRLVTTARLLQAITCHRPDAGGDFVEWGGANSCFIDSIYRNLQPLTYTVIDNNQLGLSLLKHRAIQHQCTYVLEDDVLDPQHRQQGDVVFSVGLIEHFDIAGTARAIQSHFESARSGGLVVVSFPTPTWLYRLTRWCAERLGVWAFHDERPLSFAEVEAVMQRHGEFLLRDLVWPIFLTQGILVFRKTS